MNIPASQPAEAGAPYNRSQVYGLYLVSDPGVGIRQPDWHGASPGTEGDGGEENQCDMESEKCLECAEGMPCDDGDPCTVNDLRIDGKCEGRLPLPLCGANSRTPVDYSGWTESEWSETYSAAMPKPLPPQYDVCFDPAAMAWRLVELFYHCPGEIKLARNYKTPILSGPDQNVFEYNLCDIIADLSDYLGEGYQADQGWHTKEVRKG